MGETVRVTNIEGISCVIMLFSLLLESDDWVGPHIRDVDLLAHLFDSRVLALEEPPDVREEETTEQ